MPEEIEFTIDEDGNLTYHIQGVKGRKCEDIEKVLNEALGKAKASKPTAEFYEQEVVKTAQVKR